MSFGDTLIHWMNDSLIHSLTLSFIHLYVQYTVIVYAWSVKAMTKMANQMTSLFSSSVVQCGNVFKGKLK